jgi:hydroxypyruvate isomerase
MEETKDTTPDEVEKTKPASKPKSKSQVKRYAITSGLDVEEELKKFEEDTEKDVKKGVQEVDKYAKILEGKSMRELISLHDEAIKAEDAAKRELVVMRQRAANLASTVDKTVDEEVIQAKVKVEQTIEWLEAIERKLKGVPRDIWGAKYGRSN